MHKEIQVSIIILNYNTCKMTSECIDSILYHTKDVSYEIILVDNASTDGSKEVFQNKKGIKYLYQTENLGFGKANNKGMEVAQGDYFFLLNSDTLLVNNAIKIFYEYAESHNMKAFYGCWLEDKEGNYIHSGGQIPTIGFLLWNLCKSYIPGRYQGDRSIHYSEKECYTIGYVTGADMFFHRSIYEQTKGFDPNFFMYYEEADWQRTAAREGINCYVLNTPRIIHLEGGSQQTDNREMNVGRFDRYMKSQYYYVRKNTTYLNYLFYRMINAVLYIPKLVIGKSAGWNTSIKAINVLFKAM